MSNTHPRGRAPKAASKPAPMRIFYIILGVVALVGVVALGATRMQQPAAAPTPASPGAEPAAAPPANARTADGFYYVGSADAPVVVTEYSDFQ